jgi:hypothetical protein
MIEIFLVYILMAVAISIVTIKEDQLNKNIKLGFNPNPVDRDKDGIVQEGTMFQRKVKGIK